MRNLNFIFVLLLFISDIAMAQKKIPEINVKTLEGENVQLSSFIEEGKPMVISFWATWCKPCNNELSEISDLFDEWIEEVDFNFLAVTIDDARSVSKVKSMVNGNDWPFIVILDSNQDLKRALNVTAIPHVFIYNSQKQLVYQHKGYVPGNELEIIKKLKALK